MTVKFLRRRWQKIFAVVLLIFLFLTTVVAYYINRYWSPILANELRSTVLNSTDSLYQASFTDADLHIVQGKLVVFNLTIKPDQAVYQRRLKAGLAPNNLFSLKVKRIVFSNIHPLKLYFHQQLDIGKIVLSAPDLQLSYQLNHKKDITVTHPMSAWQRIQPMFRSIHIGQVMLNDVKFKYKDYSGNKLDISELKEINVLGKDLLIDSVTQKDTSRFYCFKDVQVEVNNFARPSDNGLYRYTIKQLLYSTLTSQLQAYGVGLVPAADSVFIKRNVRTWFTFNTDTLELSHFNFLKYNKYRMLNAANLTFRRGNFIVSTNPATKPPKGNRLLTFPNVAVHLLHNDLTLDTVDLNNINITYRGHGKKSHKQGMLSFNNTNGSIYNITNNEAALARNNTMKLQLSSRLMDSGPMEADMTFNLTDSARSYTYKGTVGLMDLEDLNKATMPFGLVKITSGWLDQLSFDIKANRYVSQGNVSFLYHDLKIHVLKIDTATHQYRHRAIVSLLANALIVKRNNPDRIGYIPRTYEVKYVSQPDTAFFKSVWKTLAIGIKSAAGYNETVEKEVKQRIAQHAADKKKKERKKAIRIKRRANHKHRKR